MASLKDILNDPNYVNANPETKAAIFEKHAPLDPDFANANPETQSAIKVKFGLGGPAAVAVKAEPKEKTTSTMAGILSGLREGIIDAPAQLLERGVKAIAPGFAAKLEEVTGSPTAQQATENARKLTAEAFGAEEGSTAGRVIGNIAALPLGGAITAPLRGANIVQRGISAIPALPRALAAGAISAPLTQTVDTVPEGGSFLTEKLKQAGMGAVGGGVGYGIGRGVEKVLNPQVSENVALLMNEGVTPTPGEILGGAWKRAEDKATSIPILGDAVMKGQRRAIEEMNRAVANRALAPIGEKAPEKAIGSELTRLVRTKLGSSYDDLTGKMNLVVDAPLQADISAVQQMAKTDLPPALGDQLDNIVNTYVKQPLVNKSAGGIATGETTKEIESQLARLSRQFENNPDPNYRRLSELVDDVRTSVMQGLERSPGNAAEDIAKLKATNKGYANYVRLRTATGAAGATDNIASPAQLAAAVRKGASATEKSESSALMNDLSSAAKDVLASKYPDSGTAGRNMFAALAAIGTGHPGALVGLGLGTIPYLAPKTTAAILTKRPELVRQLGRATGANSDALALMMAQAIRNRQEQE